MKTGHGITGCSRQQENTETDVEKKQVHDLSYTSCMLIAVVKLVKFASLE